MKKAIIFLLLGLFIQSSSPIDSGIVAGKVVDKYTKRPLTGVLVNISFGDKTLDSYTDRYGRFSLSIEPGIYNITCTYFINIDTTIENVQVQSGMRRDILIELTPNTNQYTKLNSINTEDLSWKFEDDVKEKLIEGMGIIEGVIRDSTGKAITGASVYIEGTTRGTFVKKSDGRFRFNNIEPGNYVIRVNAPGFNSTVKNINVAKDSTSTIDFILPKGTLTMKEVIVTDESILYPKDAAGKVIKIRTDGGDIESMPPEAASKERDGDKAHTKATSTSDAKSGGASESTAVMDLKAITIPAKKDSRMAEASLSEPPAADGDGSASTDEVFYSKSDVPDAKAGLLTSGEVNDFRKWELWQDISQNDFDKYSREWTIKPVERYTVQLTTPDGKPAIDQVVTLIANGSVVWSGRTDNTGKAELWANLLEERSRESGIRSQNGELEFRNEELGIGRRESEDVRLNVGGNYSLEVSYNGKNKKIENVKKFHNGINFVGIEEPCNIPNNVDILFTVDATGSMGDEIEYLKAELKDIIGKLKDKKKNLTFNLGSIFYRDIGDEFIVRKSDLSTDIDKTINFINEQHAVGGGDYPEAVEMALQSSLNEISWSDRAVARILFLILDAPPHSKPEIKTKLRELTARAAIDGIRIIPVACSGVDKSTEYLMRALALATNGTYIFLTDNSGIGNPHIEPTTDKYDVELLNDLFIRLIDQFTIVPSCSPTEAVKGEEISDNIYNKDEIKINEKDENYEKMTDRLKCFPNPTNGILNIELGEKIEQLFLVDVTGKILNKIDRLAEGRQMLDLSPYPTGIYFIKFLTEGKWGSRKVLLLK